MVFASIESKVRNKKETLNYENEVYLEWSINRYEVNYLFCTNSNSIVHNLFRD